MHRVNMQDSVRVRYEADTRMYYSAEGLLQRGVAAWTNKKWNNDTVTNTNIFLTYYNTITM